MTDRIQTTVTRLVALAALAAAAGCAGQEATGTGPNVAGARATGATAIDFTARDVEGRTVKLSDHLGKRAILLNFCATWCEPCVAEFPHLRRMYEANKSRGFIILGITMDGPESVANVPAYVRRNQLNYPVLLDEDSHVSQIYNPKKAAPLSVLIDRQGKVAVIREGYNPGDEEFLAKEVENVLQGTP